MENEKSGKIVKTVEIASNLAILLAAILAVAWFAKNYRMNSTQPPPTVAVGENVALQGVDWKANGASLVLAVSTQCHFCSESGSFYQHLIQECQKHGIHSIAALPQNVEEGKIYLKKLGVPVDEVRQVPLSTLHVNGTPTLMLIDQNGKVKDVWIGKLPSADEEDVLKKLAS